MVDEFRRRLESVDGRVHEVPSLAAARATARELIDGASVARWADAALSEIVADGTEGAVEEAEVSLIVADVGVAETGAIGFVHRAGRPRATGVLPTRQIALLREQDLVATVPEALARVGLRPRADGDSHRPPANVVFAAGPSRTSDIEQKSIRGVHAPRELEVIVYRSPPSS